MSIPAVRMTFWQTQLATLDLKELEICAENLETLLIVEVARLDKVLKKQAKGMTDAQKNEFYAEVFNSDDFYRLSSSFPQTLREALFIQSYSLFEHSLAAQANSLQNKLKLDLSPTELKDDGIMRSKTYFKKVAKVGFPDNHQTWPKIIVLNRIRNCFVHRNGILPTEGEWVKEVEVFIRKNPDKLKLQNSSRQIEILAHDFIRFAIKTFCEFLEQLLLNINASLQSMKQANQHSEKTS